MITELQLQGFKNFRDATLSLGNLTLLVGTNASGKSNLRDAFRFLHGISRGYTLAEIVGEKWIEGGVLQWKGIRGGTREIANTSESTFSLQISNNMGGYFFFDYQLEVSLDNNFARVNRESLYAGSNHELIFDSCPPEKPLPQGPPEKISVLLGFPLLGASSRPKDATNTTIKFNSNQPILSQILYGDRPSGVTYAASSTLDSLKSMRFFEFNPDSLRQPSIPGQDTLGDRGENLSSVLQSIFRTNYRETILEWLRELTPQDVVDFEFVSDQTGKILVSLVESNGQKTSAYSASDGTLRFLAIIAAMLGPKPAKFYFFEELENGIHPARLHLLLQLIEQKVSEGNIQVVATTHSPQLLGYLSEESRRHAALIYRLPDQPDARIVPIMQLPEAERIVKEQDLSHLYSSGWLEDVVAFREGAEA